MRWYNRLTWERSIDLNKKYPELNKTFRFRSFNQMSLQPNIQMGSWSSDEIITQLNNKMF